MSSIHGDRDYIEITLDTIEPMVPLGNTQDRYDIESDFSYFNPLFLSIAALLVAVFIIQIQQGLLSLGDEIDLTNFTYKYANYRAGGEYIGMFTGMFLHGGIGHLFGNLLFLYILSLISYRVIRFIRSIGLFLLSGLCGSIISFSFGTLPSIGASGAIFGMFGFVSVFYIMQRRYLSENLEDLSWTMILFALGEIGAGFASPYIDNLAHLGGFVGGCLIGYCYFRIFSPRLTP